MARDMDMETRVHAFVALGKIQTVSVDILRQTLSKKAFSAMKELTYPGQYTAKVLQIPASASAFTFAHGLEDEFYEVRHDLRFHLHGPSHTTLLLDVISSMWMPLFLVSMLIKSYFVFTYF